MKYFGTFILLMVLALGTAVAAQSGKWIGSAIILSIDPSVTQSMCGTPPSGVFSTCSWGAGASYSTGVGTTPTWVQYLPPPTPVAAGITGITKNGIAVPIINGVAALTIEVNSTSTAPVVTNVVN